MKIGFEHSHERVGYLRAPHFGSRQQKELTAPPYENVRHLQRSEESSQLSRDARRTFLDVRIVNETSNAQNQILDAPTSRRGPLHLALGCRAEP